MQQSLFCTPAIIGLHFVEKENPAQLFSSEFCEMFKNTLFTEHFRTTASEYRNNMPCQDDSKLNVRKIRETVF